MVIIRRNIYNQEKEVYASPVNSHTDNSGQGHKSYGVAVDIGTTTIALSLFSLDSQEHLKNITGTNLQVQYGSDVMMRIMNVNMGKASVLHRLVIDQVCDMIEKVSEGICSADRIKEMTVTGNTVMCHLFLDKNLRDMAGAPFIPAYKGSVNVTGKDIGMHKYPGLDIYVMPGVSAHVGADAVSFLCSQQLYSTDKIQLAIDIGTNAEIILNNKGKIYACSAAAGPAFEGRGTKCGIRAGKGAINSIKISRTTGNIVLGVIDVDIQEKEHPLTGKICSTAENYLLPEGICGTGLADALAELLKAGVLRTDGYMPCQKEALDSGVHESLAKRIKTDREGNYFVFYGSGDNIIAKNISKSINGGSYIKNNCAQNNYIKNSCTGGKLFKEIYVTQKDIRSIQLAKAAIQAGVMVLLEKAGICIKKIDEMKVAGVFGGSIRQEAAISLGLYPGIDKNKIKFVGNAAGNGAAMALLDNKFKRLVEEYAEKVIHVGLADQPCFQDKFLNAMKLEKW